MSCPAPNTASDYLPTTPEEVRARGWEALDVLFVSGDAYIDHPSFAAAILGRALLAAGYRVAILSQPDWQSADPWRAFGKPRLFYAVSAGNMDSMINHYTANRKRRNADAYSPGGRIGLRPDRPTAVYAQRCREAFKGVPVVIGGVEASLRRIAHYDYWSDKVLPSILQPSKADLLVFGMGESCLLEIARRLDAGEEVAALRDMRGAAYLLGSKEEVPTHSWDDMPGARPIDETVTLPSLESVRVDQRIFAEMTRAFHRETNPLNGRRLLQPHGDRTLVVNPPQLPLTESELDGFYDLPYTRQPHPRYAGEGSIPAWDTIKDSVQIMRGCFGGCSFCSITMHQGRAIQSRSQGSIIREIESMGKRPGFKGQLSDLGGPTANMYRLRCKEPRAEAVCRRPSCLHPKPCKHIDTDHKEILALMRQSRAVPGIKRVNIASGIRMDLARNEPKYLDELAREHVGGLLKVAPEHVSDSVLRLMKKPAIGSFEDFSKRFQRASKAAGKEQYIVPYFISSHPGSDIDEMIELACFLKRNDLQPRKVQDFIPAPMDVATCMYHTGLDPETMKPVYSAKTQKARTDQRALLQYWKPENHGLLKKILLRAGREELIGNDPGCLIPERAPRGGWQRRDAADGGERGKGGKAGYRRASREGSRSERQGGTRAKGRGRKR